ncbi:MAG: HAD hydrolase-like protein [Myxococcales bacterium]|nr:HAD hydrolase-like protein [Myxococcales bacterium]
MSSPPPVPRLLPSALLERYDVVLLDSYGVLVDEHGTLPGAIDFITRLRGSGRRWMVLSNDASRRPPTSVARYRERGLAIDAEHLLTSGDLISPYFAQAGLVGRRCVVLGPPDSHALVAEAGGELVPVDDPELEVLVACDDAGYPFRETVETLVSTLYARLAADRPVALVLPNPDLVYPRGSGTFGLTAGSVARLLEGALALRFPEEAPRFVGLGKPHAPIFEHALARLRVEPGARVVMVGDQLATDVAGARAMGLDAVLVATGVSDPRRLPAHGPRPTAWLESLVATR